VSRLRSRLTLDRIALAIVLVGAFLAVLSLTRGSSGKVEGDDALVLVPRQALLYVHVRTDSNSGQGRRADETLRKLPSVARLRDEALRQVAGGRDSRVLQSQIRPWLGGEAALALLPGRKAATSLILLEVADRSRAEGFLRRAGRARPELYRGTPLRLYKTLAAAFLGDFLAIGRPRNVRAAIDAREGESLGKDDVFERTVRRLDVTGPLIYAYAPEAGVRRLLQRQPGLIGRLGHLLARPGLLAVAAAARFKETGVRVAISSELVPLLPGAAGGEATKFEPKLPAALPADAIAYFGERGPIRLFERLRTLSGGGRSPLSRSVERLRRTVGRTGERALRKALRPLRDREAALVVTPPAEPPVVTLVIGDTSRKEAGDLLVALQPLLSRLVQAPQGGQAPSLEPRQVAGVDTITLQLPPGLELTYGAFEDRIVVSTSADAIRQLRPHGASLVDNREFAPGLRGFLKQPTSVVFLDLHRLSALVERAGLSATPEYRAIRPDIAKIGTVTAITTSEQSSQTAQVFLEVP
jgi:hypothetical protein